ncbi:MAG: thioredoxin [Clostridia bacterium]|nr:thioredoxin [Clostridia bacterium]
MKEIDLTYNDFDSVVMESDKPVLVDFWATWCGPCRMLGPVIAQIAEEREDIKVCKVNVDDEPELARMFNVMSIPTVLVFKNGELKDRSVGFKPKQQILDLLD